LYTNYINIIQGAPRDISHRS